MTIRNIFTKVVTDEVIARINKLSRDSQPQWRKMNVAQMMAHCSVAYELVYEAERFPKPGIFMRLIIKLLAKPQVVTEKPFFTP